MEKRLVLMETVLPVAGRMGNKCRGFARGGRFGLIALALMHFSGCAGLSGMASKDLPPEAKATPNYSASLPATPQAPPQRPSPGSLWGAQLGSLMLDNKARNVGDTITITVSESSTAENKANTTTSRSHTVSANASLSDPTFAGKSVLGGATTLGYTGTFDKGLTGKGSTDRTNTITAAMTATVVEVLPNGNLVIRGSRWTKVNEEYQQIILEGVVRPADVTRSNTVLSQQIADARIFIAGKGPVSQVQKPGWLGQLFDAITPF